MTATKITFTRCRNLIDETEYRHETDTYRFIVRRTRDGSKLWAIEVWTLKTVGAIEPVLKIADKQRDTLWSLYLSDARINIADYIERRKTK